MVSTNIHNLATESEKSKQGKHPATVLVVDDEPELLEILETTLMTLGYTVLTAGNGKDAYQMVLNHPIDLVLTDIRMREGDGIELLNQIRTRNSTKPPVILMTAYADGNLDSLISGGAVALLGKPFSMTELKTLVGSILHH